MSILVDEPAMMLVSATREGGGLRLEVMTSVLVRPSDDLYAPVRDLLCSHCYASIEEPCQESDPDWMFGTVVHQALMVYDECPEGSVHVCLHAGKGHIQQKDD
jgi:hypothetical protein